MDGLYWKPLLKWMIWGYHHFRKHPHIYIYTYYMISCRSNVVVSVAERIRCEMKPNRMRLVSLKKNGPRPILDFGTAVFPWALPNYCLGPLGRVVVVGSSFFHGRVKTAKKPSDVTESLVSTLVFFKKAGELDRLIPSKNSCFMFVGLIITYSTHDLPSWLNQAQLCRPEPFGDRRESLLQFCLHGIWGAKTRGNSNWPEDKTFKNLLEETFFMWQQNPQSWNPPLKCTKHVETC